MFIFSNSKLFEIKSKFLEAYFVSSLKFVTRILKFVNKIKLLVIIIFLKHYINRKLIYWTFN